MNKAPLILFLVAMVGLGFILAIQLKTLDEPPVSQTVRAVSATKRNTSSADGQTVAALVHHFEALEQRKAKQWRQIRIMQIALSLCLMPASLYVVLSGRFRRQDKNWAYSVIGIIVGYWLNAAHPM